MALKQPVAPASRSQTLPAPVDGWNARDSVATMKSTDAIVLDDMFPDATQVSLRPGASNHTTGLPGDVESLMPYNGGATSQLFAASGGNFYDVTASGAVGAAVVSGNSNDRWGHINFATSSNNWLLTANGVDTPKFWNGAAWTAITAVSVPAITGVATTTLDSPVGHQNRVWFIQKNTLIAWYLPVDSVGGAATAFPLRSFATRGGYLIVAKNWSYDTNNGPKHYLAFFTSEGEVIIFSGTDPSSPTTWELTGTFYLGQLVSNRSIAKADGDLMCLTQSGLYPLSSVVNKEISTSSAAISDRIRNALAASTKQYGSNFGWEVHSYPDSKILLINVPVTATQSYQYVMNISTRRWCRVTKWAAKCFATQNGILQAGFNTKTANVWSGATDFGGSIVGLALPAFTALHAPSVEKQVLFARIYFRGTGFENILLNVNTDFSQLPPTDTVSSSVLATGATWGTARWGTAMWPSGLLDGQAVQSPGALGFQISPTVQVASTQGWSWYATDLLYSVGRSWL
jgi:hypothetical protein